MRHVVVLLVSYQGAYLAEMVVNGPLVIRHTGEATRSLPDLPYAWWRLKLF